MDIFCFFIERDMMLEATFLAEKEMENAIHEEEEAKDNTVSMKETKTQKLLTVWWKMKSTHKFKISFLVQKCFFIWNAL